MHRFITLTLPLVALGLLSALPAGARPIRPQRPNTRSTVQVRIPHQGGSGCRMQATIRRERHRGRTILHASASPVGRCRAMLPPGSLWHTVGRLQPSGRFVLRTSGGDFSFMVLPVPEETVLPVDSGAGLIHVKAAIVRRFDPGVCRGAPSVVTEQRIARFKRRHRRLWRAIQRLFPAAKEDAATYRRARQVQSVTLTLVRRGTYRYRFEDGACCRATVYEGQVEVVPEVEIGPRRAVRTLTRPC